MANGPRLELRQSQNLVMTTQLRQSIKLLQLSAMELGEYLVSEVEQNPLLTRDEGEGSTELPDEFDLPETPKDYEGEERRAGEDVVEFSESHQGWDDNTSEMIDAPREAFWDDAEGGAYTPSAGATQHSGGNPWDDSGNLLESTVSETQTLRDYLQEQLPMAVADPVRRMIGLHIIDLADERGYVPEDLSQVADALQCDPKEVLSVLYELQRLDPLGVCARNLSECLAIQLREKDRLDPAMEKMLLNLDVVANGDMARLAKICGVDGEDIPLMLAEIRELNPKPGLRFGSDPVQTVIPDVFLRKSADGGWQVELNADALPRVLMNRQYYTQIAQGARRKEDKKYLSEQLAHANWLIKALDQRAQTILKVATEIVRQQDAFFRHGVRHFKPLVLRDIADAVEMHESTVSRVTTQKYLTTGTAVYELKYFFSSALGSRSESGDAHSSEAVKDMILELIDQEAPKAILSDDAIAAVLKEKGVDIARRTVAKYREAMDISSSSVRRREKKRL